MRINHNALALNANNHLKKVEGNLSTSISKLSSGYKINKASDDAAGMAISQKMQTQIRGLSRANNNAGDGVSLVQTAEGAIDEIQSILKRIRELTVQAANETYGDDDITSINNEIVELQNEIDQISKNTQFNGRSLLNGESDRRCYSDDKGLSVLSITDGVANGKYGMEVTSVGTQASYNGGTMAGVSTTKIMAGQEGTYTINGVTVSIEVGDTVEEAFERLRDAFDKIDLELYATNDGGATSTTINQATSLSVKSKYAGTAERIELTCSNTALSSMMGLSPVSTTGTDAVVSIDTSTEYADTATITSSGNTIIIKDRDGFEMKVNIDPDKVTTGVQAELTVLSAGALVLQIGADEGQTLNVTLPKITSETLGIDRVNISTHELASKAIDLLDAAVKKTSEIRSKIGAYQNRLEHTMENLDITEENLTSAISRITDTDMAEEMATYTQYNVLSQASIEMLSKANARPESLLQLLQ